jgi:SulP family sulfate permease
VTAKFGIAGLQLATLMAGVMLLLMGIVRMGGAIRFIPPPVVVGFTAGIAVIIFSGSGALFWVCRQPRAPTFVKSFCTNCARSQIPTCPRYASRC